MEWNCFGPFGHEIDGLGMLRITVNGEAIGWDCVRDAEIDEVIQYYKNCLDAASEEAKEALRRQPSPTRMFSP